MKNRKKLLLVLLAIIAIIGVTIGVTLAFFSYTKEGSKENTITVGAITFHYNEDSLQGIQLLDALPLSDADGKTQNNYFDFTITSNNNMETTIPYQITSRKVSNSSVELDEQYVKMYLTKLTTSNNTTTEDPTPLLYDTYNNLPTVQYNNHDEEILWTDIVPANTISYTQKYRLRMWLADTLDFSPEKNQDGTYKEVNGEYVYPNNNKQFSIKLNVYAGDAKQANPAPEITGLTMNTGNVSEVLDSSLGYDYVTSDLPQGTTSTTLNITTVNSNDTVTVEKLNGLAINNDTSNIRRLSTTRVIQLNDLEPGDNYYKITITNVEETVTTYIIKVIVDEGPKVKILNKRYTIKQTTPDLTEIDTTNNTGKVYASIATSSGNPTYYFRGQVDDNYVDFAGFTWRIIRVNEDGTIRLIMTEGINNNVDYYYYRDGDSAFNNISTWYQNNIGNTEYDSLVANGNYFCSNYENSSFICSSPISAQVGTITEKEIIFAGGKENTKNSSFYLHNNTWFWTMNKGIVYSGTDTSNWGYGIQTYPVNVGTTTGSTFRPVINLDSSVITSGSGTQQDPFRVITLQIYNTVFEGENYNLPSNITVTNNTLNIRYKINNNEITNTKDLAVGTYTLNYELYTTGNTLYAVGEKIINVVDHLDYLYGNSEATITLRKPGTYKLEVWGAAGGYAYSDSYSGGKGGYATGEIEITTPTTLYINVGGQGESNCNYEFCIGGYNGGGRGAGSSHPVYSAGGGGATSISFNQGLLSSHTTQQAKNKILIVAGGGGGATYQLAASDSKIYGGSGGAGGGTTGISGTYTQSNHPNGTGGTQSSGGSSGNTNNGNAGSFGQGGNGNQYAPGGGGGYYGGGSAKQAGAGGGSSYIGGVSNGSTIDGATSMPSPTGGNETGHSGNGYARITYLGN